jgi:FKBP-type peptidyl-prolyl cis-trans isomerase
MTGWLWFTRVLKIGRSQWAATRNAWRIAKVRRCITLRCYYTAMIPRLMLCIVSGASALMLGTTSLMAQSPLEKGDTYMKQNAGKPGVQTTASGLQYEVLREGTGRMPAATDKVEVNYRGTLLDGTEFDSSYKRGQPIDFRLNQVIKGWTEGVQLMKEGAKYRFVIPPKLAYGQRGAPPAIGPDETLIFEVELIKVL